MDAREQVDDALVVSSGRSTACIVLARTSFTSASTAPAPRASSTRASCAAVGSVWFTLSAMSSWIAEVAALAELGSPSSSTR